MLLTASKAAGADCAAVYLAESGGLILQANDSSNWRRTRRRALGHSCERAGSDSRGLDRTLRAARAWCCHLASGVCEGIWRDDCVAEGSANSTAPILLAPADFWRIIAELLKATTGVQQDALPAGWLDTSTDFPTEEDHPAKPRTYLNYGGTAEAFRRAKASWREDRNDDDARRCLGATFPLNPKIRYCTQASRSYFSVLMARSRKINLADVRLILSWSERREVA